MAAGYDLIFYDNSDNTIILEQLKNKVTDSLITGATVTVEVFDDVPASILGPLGFTEDPSVNGKYTVEIDDSTPWVFEDTGHVVIIAIDTAGSGSQREWTLTYIVQRGRSRV
jgi:hypothetical protein